jgi:hypothetical protein
MQSYMVGMEAFHNLEGHTVLVNDPGEQWLPYRLNFMVTAEPGWWVRTHGHDAVVELAIAASDGKECRVLSVSPHETAQALSELESSFQSLALAGELEGTFRELGLGLHLDRLKAAAERLEGLRTNTSTVVGFPSSGSIRIRMRPELLPNQNGRDLQPTSRLFTATVLIKNDNQVSAAGGGSPAARGNGLILFEDAPATDAEGAGGATTITAQGSKLTIEVKPYYEPSLGADSAGDFEPPCHKTRVALETKELAAYVPVWPTTQRPSLSFEGDGVYWLDDGKVRAVIRYRLSNGSGQPFKIDVAPGLGPDGVAFPLSLKPKAGLIKVEGLPSVTDGAPIVVAISVSDGTAIVTSQVLLRPATHAPEPAALRVNGDGSLELQTLNNPTVNLNVGQPEK